jgi:carboxyl-terminal processing protease
MGINQQNSYKDSTKKYSIFALLTFFILVFGAGLFIGRVWTIQNQVVDENGEVEINKVLDLYSKTRSSEIDFEQFWDLWDMVKEKYVVQPVDDVDLFYGAMQGLVSGLDDPYSVYFPPIEAEEFAKDLSGEFEGIGAEISLRGGQLTVVAPLKGSPAELAGLKPGDKIFGINGEETFDMGIDEAVKKIRGPKGTEVTLTVTSNGFDTLQEVVVVRDTINVPTVEWEMKDGGVVYFRIAYFNQDTWSEFDKAVREFLPQSPKGIVLDLRSNPGGYLDTAIAVASEWIDNGTIVSERFGDDEKNKYTSNGQHRLSDIKTVVLVDGGSASASEIVAGALQDYGVAQIIGEKTFGKGSVQDFELLSDGSAIKLTVAKWFTPDGRQIDEEGIMPDVLVEEMFTNVEVDEENGDIDYIDNGLNKAMEILNQ